ncbi:MAG: HTH domain-containing protein [Candidatus Aenigmatarchaeota archaeon]
MAQADWDNILKELLEFNTVKADINDISNSIKLVFTKINELEKELNMISQQVLEQNNKIDSIAQYMTEQIEVVSEQVDVKNETVTEQPSAEQPKQIQISSATGRYREILSLLINEGFFTYTKLAERMRISQSRARAYIADLKKYYSIPITSVKDTEGVKVGISPEFVDKILGVR